MCVLKDPSPSSPVSPIAQIQSAGQAFAAAHELGTHITQVGIVMEFFTGMLPPRNLYSGATAYRVWGSTPFAAGDFAATAVLDLFYPGFASSSYYHNESGFMTPTPYGDTADVLLSDCAADILARYPVLIIVTPIISAKAETAAKLEDYVARGGTLVTTALVLGSLQQSVMGVSVPTFNPATCTSVPKGSVVNISPIPNTPCSSRGDSREGEQGKSHSPQQQRSAVTEAVPVISCPVSSVPATSLVPIATTTVPDNQGIVSLAYVATTVTSAAAGGKIVVFASTGISSAPQVGPIPPSKVSGDNSLLPTPFPMATHVRAVLDNVLQASATLFTVGPQQQQQQHQQRQQQQQQQQHRQQHQHIDTTATAAALPQPSTLSIVVNRVSSTEYLVAVANSELTEQPFQFPAPQPSLGTVQAIEEIALPDAALAKANVSGYMPTGFQGVAVGKSTATTIAGLDQRIFKVTLANETARLLPTVAPQLRMEHVVLPLQSGTRDFQTAILQRPTFQQHASAVVLNWRDVEAQTKVELARVAKWTTMQNITVHVDFTSGLNLYPDLRLCNNSQQYSQSIARMAAIFDKMGVAANATTAGAETFSTNAIVAAHRWYVACSLLSFILLFSYRFSFAHFLLCISFLVINFLRPFQNINRSQLASCLPTYVHDEFLPYANKQLSPLKGLKMEVETLAVITRQGPGWSHASNVTTILCTHSHHWQRNTLK